MRNSNARPPLPSVAHVAVEPLFTKRFESGRFYRVPGEQWLFCALLCAPGPIAGDWRWEFRRGPALSLAIPHIRASYSIYGRDDDRVYLTMTQDYLIATRLDWRDFQRTDFIYDPQAGRRRRLRP